MIYVMNKGEKTMKKTEFYKELKKKDDEMDTLNCPVVR